MKKTPVYLFIFFIHVLPCCGQAITVESLVNEMTSKDGLTRYPDPSYKLIQFSSYNRASVSPLLSGWYENFDMSNFIRIDSSRKRREFVMVDVNGPGAIVRWWMTFYKAQNGIIRIYIDKKDQPVLIGEARYILSGETIAPYPFSASVQKGAPLGEEGRDYDHNLYLPIPFAKHCLITYESESLQKLYVRESVPVPEGYYWPDVFYNINVRLYPPGTKVRSFSAASLRKAEKIIRQNAQVLMKNTNNHSIMQSFDLVIHPNDSASLSFESKNEVIDLITINMGKNINPDILRNIFIDITFDGNKTVHAPTGVFFGTGYNPNTFKTWMMKGSSSGSFESFWKMPFKRTCTITFCNYSNQTVTLKGSTGFSPYKWTQNSMYFGCSWNEYKNVETRKNGSPFDISFVEISGKGKYVGDVITIYNPTWYWWGEGDEKIWVDNDTFPSCFGTGTEDYYGYAFGRPESFSHLFICQPEGNGNIGKGITTNIRIRSLDAIPFSQAFKFDMELWHWAHVKMDYAITTFYYVFPGFRLISKNQNYETEHIETKK